MRIIGMFVMCLLFAACTSPPFFSPEIMKGAETDTFDLKAWKEQADHPSGTNFVPHKVELGGQFLKVISKEEGVVILAEEKSLERYPGYDPTWVKREGEFVFAIVFKGSLEPSMLEAGNELAVVGTTDRPSPELIDGTPKVLPHLNAQCLHIWKTKEAALHYVPWVGSMGYYPPENRTFCLENTKRRLLSTERPSR